MQSLGTIKRGDTFSFTAQITDTSTSAPLTGAAASLKCQGRYVFDGDLVSELVVSETSTPGTYLFVATDTSSWRAGYELLFDIQYSAAGAVSSSETLSVNVEGDLTHA